MFWRLNAWLEQRWLAPSYSGWILIGLSLFFLASAVNTMAGWLYVISGTLLALLAIAAVLSERSLRRLSVQRSPIAPVTAGESLQVELSIHNPSSQPVLLFQVGDRPPEELGDEHPRIAVEHIAKQGEYRWLYSYPTRKRGVYTWHQVDLRTAAPLGLFWCRRSREAKAIAIIYPQVLTLTQCPILDDLGQHYHDRIQSSQRTYGASEGLTRALRPYRWGDPIRLVHWRTSARYGELRVRELEVYTGGRDVVIYLNSAIAWEPELFEQAVTVAASLYAYATRAQMQVSLWTAGSGLVTGLQSALHTLARVQFGESMGDRTSPLSDASTLIYLTFGATTLTNLPQHSRWLLWSTDERVLVNSQDVGDGLMINAAEPLQPQIQAPYVMSTLS
jgi:uncharacterized protein (DUF58 family)